MGRGRGKGKKQSAIAARDDTASGEEEKIPVRRRGRPQKPVKDDIEVEEQVEKIEDEDDIENTTGSVENGRKRKKPSPVKENAVPMKEENGVGTKTNPNEFIKSVGFRQHGSRRKNKPRRAAEVGVECT